jgi:hypothetical protein
MECTLHQFIPLCEDKGGNGRMLLMEVQLFHVSDSVYTEDKVDPRKMDLAARMGYDWYCRAHGDALFEVKKPRWNGIGVDALPEYIRTSELLTGAQLAKLASVKEIPEHNPEFSKIPENISGDSIDIELASGNPLSALHIALQTTTSINGMIRIAQSFLHLNDIESAWQVLLMIMKR